MCFYKESRYLALYSYFLRLFINFHEFFLSFIHRERYTDNSKIHFYHSFIILSYLFIP